MRAILLLLWLVIGLGLKRRAPRRMLIRMDDEAARLGIKVELTTRDDYLESGRFLRLSSSGYDLTPWTDEERSSLIVDTAVSASADYPHAGQLTRCEAALGLRPFKGIGQKGLYVTSAGLPVFSTGFRIDSLCDELCLYFSEPCDPDHASIHDGRVHCPRSGQLLGVLFLERHPQHKQLFQIDASKVVFLDMVHPLPPWAQPENFWGTEGQFRGWNSNELVARPLSY